MTITALVGNPRPGSRTRTAALHTAHRLAQRSGHTGLPQVVELADLAPGLLDPAPTPAVGAALERVRTSDLLVVASPTYKATYTGLLKVFLDLLPAGGLRGVAAVPLMVMASPAHTLAVEVHLRPLLVELGAHVPHPGLAVPQDGVPAGEEDATGSGLETLLSEWMEHVHPAPFPATPPTHRADARTVG